MTHRPTPRELAAIECAALDVAIMVDGISAVTTSGIAAVTSMKRLGASFDLAALDEIERLDAVERRGLDF